jgi:hypothetical protein
LCDLVQEFTPGQFDAATIWLNKHDDEKHNPRAKMRETILNQLRVGRDTQRSWDATADAIIDLMETAKLPLWPPSQLSRERVKNRIFDGLSGWSGVSKDNMANRLTMLFWSMLEEQADTGTVSERVKQGICLKILETLKPYEERKIDNFTRQGIANVATTRIVEFLEGK